MAKQNVKEKSKLSVISDVVGIVIGAIALLGIAFNVGYWKCSIDKHIEAMEVEQRHNVEISNLKLEHNRQLIDSQNSYNNQIMQLKAEIDFLKATK